MNPTALVIRRLTTLAVILLAMLALAAPAAWAKTFTVNSTAHPGSGVCDATECTLQEAVTEANTNGQPDTINFAPGLSGEIELSTDPGKGGFSILNDNNQPLTINGPGAGVLAVDGNKQTRAFGIASGANATINGLTIKNGRAPGTDPNGGGISSQGTLTLTNTTVSFNDSNSYGGGIYNTGTMKLTNSTVRGNFAAVYGGGLYNEGGTMTLTNTTVGSGNSARLAGGLLNNGTMTLNDSTVDDNDAQVSGGGIETYGTLTLNGSTVSNNTSDLNGGGISSYTNLSDRSTTIRNSTISLNAATGAVSFGGGILNRIGFTRIENSTIASNTATAAAGSGVASLGAANTSTEVLSTIISANANNNDVEHIGSNAFQSFRSFGYNLIGGGDATSAFNQPGDRTGVTSPGLGPLANNGGTTLTQALLPGSPAIDAGSNANCPSTDQRGQTRPQDGDGNGTAICDIGAFEKTGTSTPPPGTAPVAKADLYTAIEDQKLIKSARLGVLKNDIGTRPLTAKLVAKPKHGTLTLFPKGSFIYKPKPNFFGKDTFTYRATNSAGTSRPVTVTINVKSKPG
jgi:hypothetical protein